MSNKKALTILCVMLAIALALSIWNDYGRCRDEKVVDVRTDTVTDTVYIKKTDTLPKIKYMVKIKEVHFTDTVKDSSVAVPVVQKVYSDDSTYTAYVSGLEYGDMPKLDSIVTRRMEVVERIKEVVTIEDRQHFKWGLQVGAGYGVFNKKPDIFIGFGGTWSF